MRIHTINLLGLVATSLPLSACAGGTVNLSPRRHTDVCLKDKVNPPATPPRPILVQFHDE